MWTTVGTLLPFALGVAISPIPIIAVILMLFSPRAAVNGPVFLAGWVVALAAVCTAFVALARLVGAGGGGQGASVVGGVIHITLGVLFLGGAAQMMRKAPKEGEPREDPGWMKVVETATPGKAARLGFLLSALNPVNLACSGSGMVAVAQAGVTTGATVGLVAVFIALGSSSVALPVLYYHWGGGRARQVLTGWKGWLREHNRAATLVLLLIVGTTMLGQGIRSLAA